MFKKIILFILIASLPLMAFMLDVKDKIESKKLEAIVKNGWNDENKTLNSIIVKNAEKELEPFNKRIKHPFSVDVEKGTYILPKINLSRDDILLMLSYIKYLEKNRRLQEAKKIYINILSGLADIKKVNTILIVVIADTVYESFVIEALSQTVKKNIYSTEDKKEICSLSRKALIMDKDFLIKALRKEKEYVSKVWEKSTTIDVKNYLKQKDIYSGKVSVNFIKDVDKKIKKYSSLYYKKIFKAIEIGTPMAFNKFEIYIEKERQKLYSFGSKASLIFVSLFNRMEILFGVDVVDFGYTSSFLAKSLVLMGVPKARGSFNEYIKQLEVNKKFLKEFGCD